MKTLMVILICIALVGVELGAVALLVAPRAVSRWLRSTARTTAERLGSAVARIVEGLRQLLGGGPGLRPPRIA